jgi:hypothetical protein
MEIAEGALAGYARSTGGNLLGQVVLIFNDNKRSRELFQPSLFVQLRESYPLGAEHTGYDSTAHLPSQ